MDKHTILGTISYFWWLDCWNDHCWKNGNSLFINSFEVFSFMTNGHMLLLYIQYEIVSEFYGCITVMMYMKVVEENVITFVYYELQQTRQNSVSLFEESWHGCILERRINNIFFTFFVGWALWLLSVVHFQVVPN